MEERYLPVKMKRKYLDEVNDEFSDFCLSPLAQKIRRLDGELLPVIKDEEMADPMVFEQSVPSQGTIVEQLVQGSPVVIDQPTDSLPENLERAIVLFKPMSTSSLQSRSTFSFSVNSDLLSGFKNPLIWSKRSNELQSFESQKDSWPNNECLAVVPWVASNLQHSPVAVAEVKEVCEMMDADDTKATTMDTDDLHMPTNKVSLSQHCMIPQHPRNFSTPITWLGGGAA